MICYQLIFITINKYFGTVVNTGDRYNSEQGDRQEKKITAAVKEKRSGREWSQAEKQGSSLDPDEMILKVRT